MTPVRLLKEQFATKKPSFCVAGESVFSGKIFRELENKSATARHKSD